MDPEERVDDESYFHSLNSVDFYDDGPGDTTIRPCAPERLEFMKALRARVMEAEATKNGGVPPQNPQES